MDYNNYNSREPWLYVQQNNQPFYMPYPMQAQSNYLNEMEYEKDLDRMKELYPREVKRIQKYVEDECDRMEYEGSLMFDEYPDKTMLQRVCRNIMEKVQEEEMKPEMEEELESSEYRRRPSRGDGFGDLIEVLLYNEMYKRRCRRRRCNRWW